MWMFLLNKTIATLASLIPSTQVMLRAFPLICDIHATEFSISLLEARSHVMKEIPGIMVTNMTRNLQDQ